MLAVFSGHDHRGEIAFRNGIHYFVLEGNVGMSRDWSAVSPTNSLDAKEDCPFTLVEIREKRNEAFNGLQTYQVSLKGNAQQYTFADEVNRQAMTAGGSQRKCNGTRGLCSSGLGARLRALAASAMRVPLAPGWGSSHS